MVAIAVVLDRNYFTYFYLQVILMLPTKFLVNWPFSSRAGAKKDFQDGRHDLGFPIRTILAIFDLQVTPMLPIFRISWSFGSGEDAKNRVAIFLWQPSCSSERNGLSNVARGSPKDHSCEIISKSVHLLRRRRFKVCFFSIFSSGCHFVHPSGTV